MTLEEEPTRNLGKNGGKNSTESVGCALFLGHRPDVVSAKRGAEAENTRMQVVCWGLEQKSLEREIKGQISSQSRTEIIQVDRECGWWGCQRSRRQSEGDGLEISASD